MFRRILVPIDGSPAAEQAIPFAAHLARQGAGAVLLTRVMGAPRGSALPSGSQAAWTVMAQTWADIAATSLAHAASHPTLADVGVETEVAYGDVARGMLTLARVREVDAIVLCAQCGAGVADWGLNDVARQVIRAAEVPVLAVPQYGAELEPLMVGQTRRAGRRPPLRAVVALDGSPHAEAALGVAVPAVVGLAAGRTVAMHLVHVAADYDAMEDGHAYLSAVAHDLRTGPFAEELLTPTWSVAHSDDVARSLLAHTTSHRTYAAGMLAVAGVNHLAGARDAAAHDEAAYDDGGAPSGADMLVMATYGHRGPAGWDAERIVERVLRLATCPVLVVRPPVDGAPALSPGGAYARALGDAPLVGSDPMPAEDMWW